MSFCSWSTWRSSSAPPWASSAVTLAAAGVPGRTRMPRRPVWISSPGMSGFQRGRTSPVWACSYQARPEVGTDETCDGGQLRLGGVPRRDLAPQRARPTLPHPARPLAFPHKWGKSKLDPALWKNRLKPYDLLSRDEESTIHEQAMTILEEIGVDFLHGRARDLFAKAGMRVEDNRVRFERAFVMEQVAKTPPTFDLQARNPARSV